MQVVRLVRLSNHTCLKRVYLLFICNILLELSLKPQINFCFFSSISGWMASVRLRWLLNWLIFVTWRTYSLLLYDVGLICCGMKYYNYKIHNFEIYNWFLLISRAFQNSRCCYWLTGLGFSFLSNEHHFVISSYIVVSFLHSN